SDSEYDLSLCDDFSPIDVPEGKSMIFYNPLFDSNNDFTSSDDESLSDEDVLKDNVKIYSNPVFEFDDEYISSDVNPLFDEVLENIKNKDSYDSNIDVPDLLITPLSDANKDKCFDPFIFEMFREQAANLCTHSTKPSRHFNSFYDDDDDYEESTIPLNEIISQIPPSIVITTSLFVLPIEDPEDFLIMGNEELSTILEKESDEFTKSSVEDLVPIPSESEDTSRSDSEYDLSLCDDFSPIDDPEDFLIMGNEELSAILEKESDEFTKSSVEDLVPIPSESEDTSKSDSEYDLSLCDDFSPIDVPEGKSMIF
nr:hypothetical protein [Tanacetum cinerariifolium]